jgi:hypothetical protein
LRHRIQHPATEFNLPKMQPIPKTQQFHFENEINIDTINKYFELEHDFSIKFKYSYNTFLNF